VLLLADAVANVIAAVGVVFGVGGVAFGFLERRKVAQRAQAERVTAWAEKRVDDERVVVVNNGSDNPIHEVEAWLVPADHAGGVPDKQPTRRTATIEPHDDREFRIETSGTAPAKRPRVVVAFEDADGRKWLRRADRRLVRR
jgi:hypothetical protein